MILIAAEHSDGKPTKGTLELVSVARQLGESRGQQVKAVVTGPGAEAAAGRLADWCDEVYWTASEALDGAGEPLVSALAQLAHEQDASLILMSCNRRGQAVAPRLAVRLKGALLEDVTAIETAGDGLRARRFTYLARVTETVETDADFAVISVKPGAVDPAPESGSAGTVTPVIAELAETDERVTRSDAQVAAGGKVALGEADIVVAGGRGVGSAEGFASLVEPLAAAMGAGVGATRAVVDAGWRPFAEQVGQTGATVSPKLYVAVGISGAVQHLSGMNRSRVIVAINRDSDAPIFRICDYGVVGDASQIVPELIKVLQEG